MQERTLDRTKRAVEVALTAHETDKWGEWPYTYHLAMVSLEARYLAPDNEFIEAAAWLHDVIEDHPDWEVEVSTEFPELIDSLLIVTRNKNETYNEFITRVVESGDYLAINLKLADMTVNLGHNPRESLRVRYEENIGRLQKAVKSLS